MTSSKGPNYRNSNSWNYLLEPFNRKATNHNFLCMQIRRKALVGAFKLRIIIFNAKLTVQFPNAATSLDKLNVSVYI